MAAENDGQGEIAVELGNRVNGTEDWLVRWCRPMRIPSSFDETPLSAGSKWNALRFVYTADEDTDATDAD